MQVSSQMIVSNETADSTLSKSVLKIGMVIDLKS